MTVWDQLCFELINLFKDDQSKLEFKILHTEIDWKMLFLCEILIYRSWYMNNDI